MGFAIIILEFSFLWIVFNAGQKRVLIMGEKDTHMGKPNTLKMIITMLTNHAPGE